MDIYIATFIIAISTGFLAWAMIELGSKASSEYKDRFQTETQVHMHELFFSADPKRLFIANISAMFLCAMLAWLMLGSVIVVVVVAAVFLFLPRWAFTWLRKRRIETIETQLPDALLMISGGARAGQSLLLAMRQIAGEVDAPLSQELDVIMREQRLGVALEDSLENFSRRVPTQSVGLMVSAMRIANETGGGLAETLERTAETLRATHAMELKIRSLTAQGKMQAWVVGLLPVFMIWILHKLEPEPMSMLWTTPVGYAVLATIILMEIFGVMLIRRIVAIEI